MRAQTCPYCGSANVDCDTVDNGVGIQQCGPYGCEDCHSYELSGAEHLRRAEWTEEEKRTNWRRGSREWK